jgi:hypothetical protein
MYLDSFYARQANQVRITPEQGSRFAKEISDDFNPLHNPDSKRFCVPGDLLFALTLATYGLSQSMQFKFTGMVGKDTDLLFLPNNESQIIIGDTQNKTYLEVTRQGEMSQSAPLIEAFSKAYVAFSGHSFPHILVPLMQQNNVMINPEKPMVIYESMAFEFDDLKHIQSPNLELSHSELIVNGKRGNVRLEFVMKQDGQLCGKGYKTMVLSGLRDYEDDVIQDLIERYENSKQAYRSPQ